MPTSEPRVAVKDALVVITNYNGKHFMKGCLDSVCAQAGPSFDVLVVENGSRDGSLDFIRQGWPGVMVEAIEVNTGYGRGLNAGFAGRLKGYRMVVFLSNDVVVEPGWLQPLVEALDADPRAALCNSRVINARNGLIDTAGGRIINLYLGILGGCFSDQPVEAPLGLRGGEPFEVFYADLCSLAVRSSALEELGGFDESYYMYFEEVDLSWRARLKGMKVICAPRSCLTHIKGGTPKTRELSLHILKGMDRNLLCVYFKHLAWHNLLWVLPMTALARLASSLIYLPVSPRIVLAKLKGLLEFLGRLPALLPQRRALQRGRLLSDGQVFSSNPGNPWSLGPILALLLHRIHDIGGWYRRGGA
jgi:GT2 family glycosyltransferase